MKSIALPPGVATRRQLLAGGGAALATLTMPAAARAVADRPRSLTLPAQPSRFVAPRKVTVFLPESYYSVSWGFPVLYVLDGQKLVGNSAGSGVHANLVGQLDALAAQSKARAAIVVGIWSSEARMREFLPARALARFAPRFQTKAETACDGPALSDDLVRYLAEELKPSIDQTFRTLPSLEDTSILGSGMGGLAALYAFGYARKSFGNAACISAAEPLLPYGSLNLQADDVTPIEKALERCFDEAIPPAAGKRALYIDYGNVGRDLFSTGFQGEIEPVLWRRGYREGRNLATDGAPLPDMTENSELHRLRAALTVILKPCPFVPALPGEDF